MTRRFFYQLMVLTILFLTVFFSAGCGKRTTEISLDEITEEEAEDTSRTAESTEAAGSTEEAGAAEATGAAGPVGATKGETPAEVELPATLYVYVCGAVKSPDVYELPAGSRVCHAIEAAGGMNEDASEFYINQAELLVDGERIYVPTEEEVEAAGSAADLVNDGAASDLAAAGGGQDDTGESAGGKVNLNTASKEELMTLTGIGEKKAEAIISYRESSGGFHSIEELMQVDGIKEGTFEKLKDEITI